MAGTSLAPAVDEITEGRKRKPEGAIGRLLFVIALIWALFQLYIASPLPHLFGRAFIINDTQARIIHYAFIIFFVFCLYPARRRSDASKVPLLDWLLAFAGASTALYMLVFGEDLARRAGAPTWLDVWISMLGLLFLFEASRRSIGLPLLMVSVVFCAYAFAGPYMPDILLHPGTSLGRFADAMWLSTEGVFGIPLGVSTSLIFLFVLFGALLEKMGAGLYLVQVTFSLLGHLRGGPAKACVMASAVMGTFSGSTIANIVTTGTFTIPLMKRIGYPPAKAAAIETSSSLDAQLMPPVMGAAAFVMAEFVGISYAEVCKAAFLPAVLSYVALYYIVHLEAVKLNLPYAARPGERTLARLVFGGMRWSLTIVALCIFSGFIYYGLGWIKDLTGPASPIVMSGLFLVVYVAFLWISTKVPPLQAPDPKNPLDKLPETVPTLLTGLHYLLPVFVLIWCLMVERLSPGLAVMWGIAAAAVVLVTQRTMLAVINGERQVFQSLKRGTADLLDGMAGGSFTMVSMGMALASAGIIVGVVALTGAGISMTSVIGALAGNSVVAILFWTALASLVLGTALPTIPSYIVVSAVMVPSIIALAPQSGLVIPLIGAHLFIFYFGLISGTTPPVAIDAYAGAAVANADPFETCMQSFYYSMRTTVVAFCFVLNPALLLMNIESLWGFALVICASLIATLLFAAATQGYFLARSRYHESGLLLIASFTLFVPSFWLDYIHPPFDEVDPANIVATAESLPDGAQIRMWVAGRTFSGSEVRKVVVLPLGKKGPPGLQRLERTAGLTAKIEDARVVVQEVRFNSPANNAGIGRQWQITTLDVPAKRMAKEWLYVPAVLLGALVAWLQWVRLPTRRFAPAV